MEYFKLFANCILVEGVNRTLIIDLQVNKAEFLPNELVFIINKLLAKKSLENVISNFGKSKREIVTEYIDYLLQNGYAFLCSYEELELFPKIDTKFSLPKKISNIIIEYTNKLSLKSIISQLEKLGCNSIHILSYEIISTRNLIKLLDQFEETAFISIELTLKYNKYLTNSILQKLSQRYLRVVSITFTDSPKESISEKNNKLFFSLNYLKSKIYSFNNCGNIKNEYFSINKDKVFEAMNHNSCLNKKISIDINGNIKNCPSMKQSFGNIKDTTLEQALNHKDFKKYWNITKDQIKVCKDCEFRYICTDCRAYIENPNDKYSKPLKCGYSPYTNKWEEWSTNPLKQKAITFYNMQELIKK